ncbi:MAG TPA: BrnT family toxin [Gammaproteobacteria bacterium]|nr:BrnT family toxin [Gammaproteobacteria bacterium]
MQFEWDEFKQLANIRKHGIDFVGCEAIFAGYTVTVEDTRYDYGEQRFITLGLLDGRVVVVIHTETIQVIRIISIRKATKHEETLYFQNLQN